MSAGFAPLAQVTADAIRILCRELGTVDTARFLNQFSTGFGNYTEERAQAANEPTVDQLLAELRQRKRKPDARKAPDKPARRKKR